MKGGMSHTGNIDVDTDLIESDDDINGLKPAVDSYFGSCAFEASHKLISHICYSALQSSMAKKGKRQASEDDGHDLPLGAKDFKQVLSPALGRTSLIVELDSEPNLQDTDPSEIKDKIAEKNDWDAKLKVKEIRLKLMNDLENIEIRSPSNKPFVIKTNNLKVEMAIYQDETEYPNKSVPAMMKVHQAERYNTPLYQASKLDYKTLG